MRPIVYACLVAAALAAAGCSVASAPSSTPRVTAPAVTPSATARAVATPSPAPDPSPSGGTACRGILAALSAANTSATAEATVKHAQYPGISVADLKSAALANELDGSDGDTIASDAAASGSAKLASVGKALLSDARTWHDYFGEASGNAAGDKVAAEVSEIGAICGDG